MAMFGWTTIKQAEVYTKATQRKLLAANAAQLVSREES